MNDFFITKKQIIRKIKINSIRHCLKEPTITKKRLNYLLKGELLHLLTLQNHTIHIFYYYNIPNELQKHIFSFL